jgi:hypothetical protein
MKTHTVEDSQKILWTPLIMWSEHPNEVLWTYLKRLYKQSWKGAMNDLQKVLWAPLKRCYEHISKCTMNTQKQMLWTLLKRCYKHTSEFSMNNWKMGYEHPKETLWTCHMRVVRICIFSMFLIGKYCYIKFSTCLIIKKSMD